jgi:hypothetical protein
MSSTQQQYNQRMRTSQQKSTTVSRSVLPIRTTAMQSQLQKTIPSEQFVMMTKFLQFNKMTRTGMKDFTSRESQIYDRLIRMYNDLAKTNKQISNKNLSDKISNVLSV